MPIYHLEMLESLCGNPTRRAFLGKAGSAVMLFAGGAVDDFIPVWQPKSLHVDRIPAKRISLGYPGDYKPCHVRLAGSELLLTAFEPNELGNGWPKEQILLYRSKDGG